MCLSVLSRPWSQVTEDAAAETPPADALLESGSDPSARRCTFLDLALALAAGVDASGAGTLFKAARAGLAERDASVQKKAYKVGQRRVGSMLRSRPVQGPRQQRQRATWQLVPTGFAMLLLGPVVVRRSPAWPFAAQCDRSKAASAA